ncbi:unnamed protein product, partial [Amoebophrya sp. A25]|eukprot:GSA25T00001343001.1
MFVRQSCGRDSVDRGLTHEKAEDEKNEEREREFLDYSRTRTYIAPLLRRLRTSPTELSGREQEAKPPCLRLDE